MKFVMKTFFAFLFLLSLSSAIYAGPGKSSSLSGTVVDVYGEPVVGAKVVLKESNEIVYTDFDGKFVFTGHDGSTTLQISMVSFEQQTTSVLVKRNNTKDLSIKLKSK